MTNLIANPNYLRKQYADSSNLDARIALHQSCSVNQYGFHAWVFDQLHLHESEEILELGCGPGYLWVTNRQRLPDPIRLTLTDYSPGMLATARKQLAEVAGITYRVVDAQELPYPNDAFRLVIANHMLYHVPDQARTIAEVRRVLRPGGRFIAATNGQSHMQELSELVSAFDPHVRTMSNAVVERFSLENGAQLLGQYFGDVRMLRYADALHVTAAAPLVNYVLSMARAQTTDERWGDRFTAFVQQRLDRDGAIHITKSSGLFVCTA
jgi:ubiquinone/menaquinone biosynthesis C-methylase UbiE